MPWHLSKSDPRKIYDETHDMVCVCRTNEQAAMVVAAVNIHRANQFGGSVFSKPAIDADSLGADRAARTVQLPKPDLAALRDAAQGDGTKDASFAVSRRR